MQALVTGERRIMNRTVSTATVLMLILGMLTSTFNMMSVNAYPNAVYIGGYNTIGSSVINATFLDSRPLKDLQVRYNTIGSSVINATVDISPGALNLNSTGKLVTGYIELQEGYNVSDIIVSSILLNETIHVDVEATIEIGDRDENNVTDLMLNFNRTEIAEFITLGGIVCNDTLTLTLTGDLYNTNGPDGGKIGSFEGSDTIKVSRLRGDADCDGKVDIFDIVLALPCFYSMEDDINWNPNLNFAPSWDIIDVFDIITIVFHYGEECP
jgi:hypothetical protein